MSCTWAPHGAAASAAPITHADPLFVSQATGDLSLQAGSPALGTADVVYANAVLADIDEMSRRVDDALVGVCLPDMGAYERATWHLDVQGEPRTGGTQVYTLTGPTLGFGIILAGVGGATEFNDPYGFLLIGVRSTVLPLVFLPTGQPFPVSIPTNPFLDGFHFEIQGIVVSPANTTVGNFTERYRATIVN